MKHAVLRIRTDEPDYSDVPSFEYEWAKIYGELQEEIPNDAPEPLGNYVTLTHFKDANLMHDLATGRSVTGIAHVINQFVFDTYSKKQATVETATYGSEFVAARTCVEQIIDIRTLLRYLGVPLRGKSYMFGDNKSVVDSATTVHAKLHKRHTILSFHRVRESIASGMICFNYIPGDINPADILSKHWGYQQVWQQLKALLFWHGDTIDVKVHAMGRTFHPLLCSQPSLIDRGANAGLAGSDVRVIFRPGPNGQKTDIQGIGDHKITGISVGTVGGVVTTQRGLIIAIMHQYALYGKGCTVHSSTQLENNHVKVHDKSVLVGGLQSIATIDGYVIPLTIKGGLVRMEIRPFTTRNGVRCHM